jgi:hypothetical protein
LRRNGFLRFWGTALGVWEPISRCAALVYYSTVFAFFNVKYAEKTRVFARAFLKFFEEILLFFEAFHMFFRAFYNLFTFGDL